MRRATRIGSVILLGVEVSLLALLAFACGKSSTSPSEPPTGAITITIMPGAVVNPKTIVVQRGSQVWFANHDSREHDMESDPHPEHTDCLELGSVGSLKPGESRPSTNLNIARTCGYHDHMNFENDSLKGTIVIQ